MQLIATFVCANASSNNIRLIELKCVPRHEMDNGQISQCKTDRCPIITDLVGSHWNYLGEGPTFLPDAFISCSNCIRASFAVSALSGTAHSPLPLQVFWPGYPPHPPVPLHSFAPAQSCLATDEHEPVPAHSCLPFPSPLQVLSPLHVCGSESNRFGSTPKSTFLSFSCAFTMRLPATSPPAATSARPVKLRRPMLVLLIDQIPCG